MTSNKCYILLLTCATTRNIHLELTLNMDVDSVIRAIKRFLARRGMIKLFISDNFQSFLAKSLQIFLRDRDIDWTHIFPKAPWWGGFYERMVRTVKDIS